MNDFKGAVLSAAKRYIEKGWSVFPLHSIVDGECTCGNINCKDAGKHPRVARGLKEASKDKEQIEKWFGNDNKTSNLAIATGEASGITVIDIDIAQGKQGAETWQELIKNHGEPVTLMSQTGSGGMHVIFQYNSVLKTASNSLGDGIDVRNDGGYIVAPPSLHKSGGNYLWFDWKQDIVSLPAHLSKPKDKRGRPKENDPFKKKYSIEQIDSMLESVPSNDRDMWRNIGIILGREYNRSEEAWGIYNNWSEKSGIEKGRNHDKIMNEAFYEISQKEGGLTIATIIKAAVDNGWAPKKGTVPIENFIYFGPGNNFIYLPTISYWIAAAVDAAVSPINEKGNIVKATSWLKINKLATSMTCEPLIDDKYLNGFDCHEGEIIESLGGAVFNSYRKPRIQLGDAQLAQPFIEHVHRVFNKEGDAEQFLNYMAHRAQKPGEKPRFALIIAGGQGVGKDTAIEFCTPAIGSWNVANISPLHLESSFNEYVSATLVRISEAANLQDMSKWAFNEQVKVLVAGSPDYCQINPKYGTKYTVRMHCGVIITTNHLASGIYIPEDDRRFDVIDSATIEEMGLSDQSDRKMYFEDLWDWFANGGAPHIAAFLHERDLSKFSASTGQRKTNAHRNVVMEGLNCDNWIDDILDSLGNPEMVRSDLILNMAVEAGENELKVRRKISRAMGRLNYEIIRNPEEKTGRWKTKGKRFTVFGKKGVSIKHEQIMQLKSKLF